MEQTNLQVWMIEIPESAEAGTPSGCEADWNGAQLVDFESPANELTKFPLAA